MNHMEAREMAIRWFHRLGIDRNGGDAVSQWQYTWLSEMVERLVIVMEDEGVPDETARRVLRCWLYGAPTEAEGMIREQQAQRIKDLMMNEPVRIVLGKDGEP